MKIIRTPKDMQLYVKSLKQNAKQPTIGFVPTMGYFHDGHLTLMRSAKEENDCVIVSVFVNPLQFGANEDLDTYPRDEQRDIELAQSNGVDVLFMPSVHDMYPNPMSAQIHITSRVDCLCGKHRPGHFDGVATVLMKLFNIVQPTRAYFGLKDAQQYAVVDGLINDFNFPIQLIGIETIREPSGLAKSSRNVHLSDRERKEADELYRSLKIGQQCVIQGHKDPTLIQETIKIHLKNHTSGKIEYVDIFSFPDLKPIESIHEPFIIAIAVQFNKARLIDNLILNEDGTQITRMK